LITRTDQGLYKFLIISSKSLSNLLVAVFNLSGSMGLIGYVIAFLLAQTLLPFS